MRAWRRLALGAGAQHLGKLAAPRMHPGAHALARQGEGDMDRTVGHAIALGAHAQDFQLAKLGPGRRRPLEISPWSPHGFDGVSGLRPINKDERSAQAPFS